MEKPANPFATPKTDSYDPASFGSPGEGVWRLDKLLIMRKDARLPDRCLRCNAPTTERLSRTLYWHPPLVYLLLLMNVIIYVVVALIVRKTAKVELPLCDAHNKRRRMGVFIALGSLVAGMSGCTVGAASEQPLVMAVSLVGLCVGVVVGLVRSSVLVPARIDATHIRAKGACPEFLSALPPFPSV